MKKLIYILSLFMVGTFIQSCTIDDIGNPNGPTQESYIEGASLPQLQLLVNGLEGIMRNDMEFYYNTVSIVGREYYDLNNTDPRYTGELLGAGEGINNLDNNGFLTTRAFAASYRAARNAEILLQATQNSNAGLDNAGKAGFSAFAKAMKAYSLLLTLNRQYNNGIRLDISNPDNLGPFGSYSEGLAGISSLLSEVITDCGAAGDEFAFTLSSGFSGFDSPAEFSKFANALKARVEMYAGNKANVLTALNGSFLDMGGDLNSGVFHVFSGSGGDRLNPLFFPSNAKYMAHNSFVEDAESGDNRLSKVVENAEVVIADGLSGKFRVSIMESNTSPFPIVRNEELILLMAEANIGSNNNQAISAINVIRNAAGLPNYGGSPDDVEALENELLKQRRYSLFAEGHRWIDMRRYDKLDQLPLDRLGDQVFLQFPRPVLEGN